jgi:hypothetical protein
LRTIRVLALGFVLLGAFLLLGYTLGDGARAALPVRLAAAAIHPWYGVAKAGYPIRDQAPIFLLIFAIPSRHGSSCWVETSHEVKPEQELGRPEVSFFPRRCFRG